MVARTEVGIYCLPYYHIYLVIMEGFWCLYYLLLFVVICLIVIDILLNSLVSYYHRYYNGMVLFIFRALLFV